MSGTVVIRPLSPADVVRWAELRSALWPDEDPAELAGEADRFLAEGDPLLEMVLVADDPADGIVGMAELALRPYAEGCVTSPVGFLEGWYVVPEHQGRGIGRALVAGAEQWARSRGCSEFASDAEVSNAASTAAHQALGFEEVAVIRCFRKSLDR